MPDANPNELFVSLILGLQSSAWMHLGKVIHPATGKIERALEEAKATIDLLGVLEEKTRGNRHPEEERLLSRVLFELRMNYVEELGREDTAASESNTEGAQGAHSGEGEDRSGSKQEAQSETSEPGPSAG